MDAGAQFMASAPWSSVDVPRNALGAVLQLGPPITKPFVHDLDWDRADATATSSVTPCLRLSIKATLVLVCPELSVRTATWYLHGASCFPELFLLVSVGPPCCSCDCRCLPTLLLQKCSVRLALRHTVRDALRKRVNVRTAVLSSRVLSLLEGTERESVYRPKGLES